MIRNNNGIWLDTSLFKTVSNNFIRTGYYCSDPIGSHDWFDFWQQERKKCIDGVSIEGEKITGDHYFYLNYCPIQKVDIDSIVGKRARKVKSFPDFWDGDYDYFWCREIAKYGILDAYKISKEEQKRVYNLPDEEKLKIYIDILDKLKLKVKPVLTTDNLEGGKDLIIGKARRRGFSFKNAAIATKNYYTKPHTYTMLMAYEKKYLFPGKKTIFGKVQEYINFINTNTAWAMPSDNIDRQNHIKASYIEYSREGIKLEKGFQSEIEAISFKDNPDAGRGADVEDIIGEEVGAWGTPGGLKDTVSAMRASSEAGEFKTGMMTLFGTSGDIEGGTADFAEIFNNPGAWNCMEFYDIWGKFPEKIEGFFFPKHLNAEGHYDKNGNSNLESAKNMELAEREKLTKKGITTVDLSKRLQEEPLDSAEAFSIISTNNFPVIELKQQLEKVKALKLQSIKGVPIELYYNEGKVEIKTILNNKVTPITSYSNIPLDKKGCVVMYEPPVDNPPKGLYKIGYDPVRQDKGTSLAGILVFKGVHLNTITYDIPVCEYIGRLESPDDMDRLAMMLAELYNAKIMYENEVTSVKNFFRRLKRLDLLAVQPDSVISKNIKNSKVSRVYGCHMTEQLKDAGERYVKDWLINVMDYDENDSPVRAIDKIYSVRLLEELISYHRKGNFDLVSALFMCMFMMQEEKLGKEYNEDKGNTKIKELVNMIKNMYKK